MKTLKNEPNCESLQDCDATIDFISRIHKLIKAMMSRTPVDALRTNDTNSAKMVL